MGESKRKALRLNRVTGDGRPATKEIPVELIDPSTGDVLRNDDGTAAAVIIVRPIDDEEHKAIIDEFTTLEKDPAGGRGLFEKTDAKAVTDEVLRRCIVRWTGIVGADDQPLVCNTSTKVAIDAAMRTQVTRKLFAAEAVVLAESFR